MQNTGYTQGNRCWVWSPAARKPTTLLQILANQARTVQCKACFEIHLLKFRAPHTQSSFLSLVANACLPSLHRFFFFFSQFGKFAVLWAWGPFELVSSCLGHESWGLISETSRRAEYNRSNQSRGWWVEHKKELGSPPTTLRLHSPWKPLNGHERDHPHGQSV